MLDKWSGFDPLGKTFFLLLIGWLVAGGWGQSHQARPGRPGQASAQPSNSHSRRPPLGCGWPAVLAGRPHGQPAGINVSSVPVLAELINNERECHRLLIISTTTG